MLDLSQNIFRVMSVVICHPHTPASNEIGKEALSRCYNLILFMPDQMDKMWGEDIGLDLAILAARGGINSVKKTAVPDFSSPDIKIVFFPSLGE